MPTFILNGRRIEAEAGQTFWNAARQAGVKIPYLCASPALKPYGSCRLCICEVEGQRGFPASCTTPVRDGMVVRTESEKLTQLRRNIIELYLSEQPENEKEASEPLRAYAAEFGLRKVRYRRGARRAYKLDESNPFF